MQLHLMRMKGAKVKLRNASQGGRPHSTIWMIGSMPPGSMVRPHWHHTDMQYFRRSPLYNIVPISFATSSKVMEDSWVHCMQVGWWLTAMEAKTAVKMMTRETRVQENELCHSSDKTKPPWGLQHHCPEPVLRYVLLAASMDTFSSISAIS